MTTYAQAAADIRAVFEAVWAPLGYPVQWPNEVSDARLPPDADTPWARGTILHAAGGPASLPGNIGQVRYAHGGIAIFQVFTRLGGGTQAAYALAQQLTNAFDGQRGPNGVYFSNTRIREIGPDGSWFQVNVQTDFDYEEVK